MFSQQIRFSGSPDGYPGTREVLYVAAVPDQALIQKLALSGWTAITRPIGRPGDHRVTTPCNVAIVHLAGDTWSKANLTEWFLIGGAHMKWIALTSKSELEQPHLRSLVCSRFYDYQTLPTHFDRLLVTLGHAFGMADLERRQRPFSDGEPSDCGLVGASEPIKFLRRSISKVGRTEAPVLICGESGSGKELASKAIHAASGRCGGPFVAVNCGAIPPSLIQSELFGYERGAFTGANRRHIGKIEAASSGTVFLDEVGDLPLDLQVNLLRFLEERRIQRIGCTEETEVDVRVIAATNVDLWRAVQQGRFREDLYYRLNVLRIDMPPLRDRPEDIVRLAEHFFNRLASERQPHIKGFTGEALAAMQRYRWPGNVRELSNRIRQALIMSEKPFVTPEDLGLHDIVEEDVGLDLDSARNLAEKNVLTLALLRSQNNLSKAARVLGVTRGTLYRLLEKHEIKVNGDLVGGKQAVPDASSSLISGDGRQGRGAGVSSQTSSREPTGVIGRTGI